MKLRRFILTILCLVAAASPCLALREIAPLTKKEAAGMGIEVRAKPGGDAVWLELEFKPEGKLKQFSHVELQMTAGEKSPVVSAALRETRSSSGSVVVSFTAGRAYLEKAILSIVLRDSGEAGDHTYDLFLKDFVTQEKAR